MYKLIVCSVDDTLLTNNHNLSADTKEALLQAQQAGARLALISRRSPENLRKIAKELHMDTYNGYIAACHGAFVQELSLIHISSKLAYQKCSCFGTRIQYRKDESAYTSMIVP